MSLRYRQEENGFKHVVEIRNEAWTFLEEKELWCCAKFLLTEGIPFYTTTGFESFNIRIDDATWSRGPLTRKKKLIKVEDEYFNKFFAELVKWKSKGTRPEVITEEEVKDLANAFK